MAAEAVIDRLMRLHHKELAREVTRRPINDVKYNTWYYGQRVNGDAFMWCAAYQSWINAMAGVPMDIYPKAAGVVQVRDFFKQRGRIVQQPKAGDYVIFIFSADEHHIGFVEKLEGGGKFTSLEGNVQNRVMRVRHREGDRGIVGYARPEYDKVEEDDMTKEEYVDVLRAALSPGFETVNEWANQLNAVKREVAEIKQMLERMQH
jgi:CHAP domain-containing protein